MSKDKMLCSIEHSMEHNVSKDKTISSLISSMQNDFATSNHLLFNLQPENLSESSNLPHWKHLKSANKIFENLLSFDFILHFPYTQNHPIFLSRLEN